MMLNGKLIIDELLIILFVFTCGGKDDKRQWSEGFGH